MGDVGDLRPTRTALLFAALIATACTTEPALVPDPEPVAPPDDPDPLSAASRGAVGASCEGPWRCAWGLACTNGRCREACPDAGACATTLGCADGACGACSEASDCRDGEACVDGFCLVAEIPEWDVIVDPFALQAAIADPYEEIWMQIYLVADGVDYGTTRMRLYGGSSREWPKKSFRITFEEDAEHPGFSRKISLRSEYSDPSFLRSRLGYHAFARTTAMPVPRARYVRLYLNGEYYGLMQEVERIGGKYLDRNGRDREQPMFEQKRALAPGPGGLMPLPDLDSYHLEWEHKTGDEASWDGLVGLVEDVMWPDFEDAPAPAPAAPTRTAEAFDLAGYIDYLAVMALLQNADHVHKNYFVTHQDPWGAGPRWEVLPYDLDMTFGCLWDEEAQDTFCDDLRWDDTWRHGVLAGPPIPGDGCWCNLGIHLAMTSAEVGGRIEDRICELAGGRFWAEEGPALVHALGEVIEDAVAEDVRDANLAVADWEYARDEVALFFDLRAGWLREHLGCD